MPDYEWAVIGSGIAGISLAEILTREGHSVVLIERNELLAGETSRDFHEWLHTGALYTLVPDGLRTLRFMLGAIDDLLEYYSSFEGMNLVPGFKGLTLDNEVSRPWFNENYIHFRYRLKNRRVTFPWLIGIARSVQLVEKIHGHDWLRRRAGEVSHLTEGRVARILELLREIALSREDYWNTKTTDLGMNSRNLLGDLLSLAIENGLELSVENEVTEISQMANNGGVAVRGTQHSFLVERAVLCNGAGVESFAPVEITKSFAPLAVLENISESAESFVQLDYFPKNCVNLLSKGGGIGLAGGISLSSIDQCGEYLDWVVRNLKKQFPSASEVSRYIGTKAEITFEGQPRNYQYHIVNIEPNVWATIPGKFTMAFSMAPEFYRRIYGRNAHKTFAPAKKERGIELLSNTRWQDAVSG